MDQLFEPLEIRGDFFICRSIPVLSIVLMGGYPLARYEMDKNRPGKYLWWFRMTESLRELLESYLRRPVTWIPDNK